MYFTAASLTPQAFVHSSASRIIGVEMNAYFCELQRDMVARHGMGELVSVVHGDVRDHAALLRDGE